MRKFESSGYTGHLAEVEAFGEPPETLSFEEFKKLYPFVRYNPERARNEASKEMDHLREMQQDTKMETPGGLILEVGPTNPRKRFARALRESIVRKLNIPSEKVKFYTSVHTVLDYRNKIDGFIDVIIDEEGKITITYDVTKNPDKDQSESDIVLQYPGYDFQDERDAKAFSDQVENITKQSVQLIVKRLTPEDKRKIIASRKKA
ncbi:MAG: hypothetical protein Q8O98_01495 [bacterium]|nr:hypothetical protein [bacterium]